MTSRFGQLMITRLLLFIFLLGGQSALLADTPLRIAVASNYASALNETVARYQANTGDTRTIGVSIGSTGKLFAQIQSGAPFDLFFAADVERPQKLEASGITLGPSQTYTTGRVVLWHPKHNTLPSTFLPYVLPAFRSIPFPSFPFRSFPFPFPSFLDRFPSLSPGIPLIPSLLRSYRPICR